MRLMDERERGGGVALLVINNDKAATQSLALPTASTRYALSSPSSDLQSRSVLLNGTELKCGDDDELPRLEGITVPAGAVTFALATITFWRYPMPVAARERFTKTEDVL